MSNTTPVSARAKIDAILDDNSFVEIGAGVKARATDFNITKNAAPSDGVITGYGVINGNLVYVYSQDAAVMNGTVGEMHAKKIEGIYDMALKMGAPVIGLIDCAGIRLQEATDALDAFGKIYRKMFTVFRSACSRKHRNGFGALQKILQRNGHRIRRQRTRGIKDDCRKCVLSGAFDYFARVCRSIDLQSIFVFQILT